MKANRVCLVCATLLVSIPIHHALGQVDYVTGTEVNALEAGFGLIYWKGDCSSPFISSDRIEHAPPTGGLVSRPYHDTTCYLSRRVHTRVCRDADGIYYFVDGHGNVRRYGPMSGTTTVDSADDGSKVPHNGPTATSGARVFWTEDDGAEFGYSRLYQAPLAIVHNAPKLVVDLAAATETERHIRKILAHSGDRVTYHTGFHFQGRLGQAVRAMRLEGGALVPYWAETPISSSCTALAEHDGYLYWAEQSGTRLTTRFYRAPVTDPGSDVLLHTRTLAQEFSVPWLAADGDFLYYSQWVPSGAGTGSLMRKEIGGGSPDVIAGPYTGTYIRDLVVQGDHLFWLATGTGDPATTVIKTLPVNAAAVTRDLRLTDLEVMQIVQDNANGVPLVAGKPTVVRAFARLWYSSIGETEISAPALNVVLEGSRGGSPLPGSPLLSYNTGPILANPTDRLDPANRQFLFHLPPEWTEAGTVSLTATVNPGEAVPETNFGNNSETVTVNFENRARLCLSVYPLRHTHGTLGQSYSPIYQSTLDRAEAALPTPELIVGFEGGDPIEEYEWDEAGYGPYELSQGDDDGWKVIFKLNGRYIWRHMSVPYCSSIGFSAVMFNDFSQRAFKGLSCWGSFISYFNTQYADINNPVSGITFAHEMGHLFDRDHVDCGGPSGIDPGYPYALCEFGAANNHMGYDPLTRTYFRWDHVPDLMAYGTRRWPSDYTWNAIRTEIDVLTAERARAEARPAPEAAACYTGGILYPDGHAEFEYTFAVDQTTAGRIQARLTGSDSSNYELRGYAGKTLLFSVPAGVWKTYDTDGDGALFGGLIPDNPATDTLVLARIKPAGSVGNCSSGTTAPTVTITKPTKNTVIGDTLDIAWKAVDPDRDRLTCQVRFSADDGVTWEMIGDGLVAQSMSVDHGPLPGGVNCRVEVRATDGIHSGMAVSDRFALPVSDPEAWIFFDTVSGRRSEWLTTVYSPVGQDVTARGKAYDAEDGALLDGALTWNVLGPEVFSGSGGQLHLPDLPSGTYHVELTAKDSSGSTGVASAQLIVDPKYVPSTSRAHAFDGRSLDEAYEADAYPVALRYPGGWVAQVYGVYTDGALHFCVANLPNGTYSLERLILYVDVGGTGGSAPGTEHYLLAVEPDGDVSLFQGVGSGFAQLDGNEGIEARVWRGPETWGVEVRLPDGFTGGYSGQTMRLAAGHFYWTSTSDVVLWPPSAGPVVPSTWGLIVLGTYHDDPADRDGDGLPDAWERAWLKGLTYDGDDDPDHDGSSNRGERAAGTDPLDGSSVFLITRIEAEGDGRMRIDWPASEGRTYTLLRTEDLNLLDVIAEGLSATTPTNSFHDPEPRPDTACYGVAVNNGR